MKVLAHNISIIIGNDKQDSTKLTMDQSSNCVVSVGEAVPE